MADRWSRRSFLTAAAAVGVGFAGLRRLAAGDPPPGGPGFGLLVRDPEGIVDLPEGFAYSVISRHGEEMDDGFLVPGLPDGMAAFPGPDGRVLVVRNHENTPGDRGPFGKRDERFERLPADACYDRGAGRSPGRGGTTTMVYDPAGAALTAQFLSLAGTWRNCAGGPTPWGSWITCEETVVRRGPVGRGGWVCDVDHGYAFEVPARAEPGLAEPLPLRAMGRFKREAVAIDPDTGIVYQTEDQHDGCLYRFVPDRPEQLAAGGRLQALALVDHPAAHTGNQGHGPEIAVGQSLAVRWVDCEAPDNPEDDLRRRVRADGAAVFVRGEGMWTGDDGIYFTATTGGAAGCGQVWRLRPGVEGDRDTLELFCQPDDKRVLAYVDNLTLAPWGGLICCEDRGGDQVRLLAIDAAGRVATFADNHLRSEFAGACFAPDGETLFVNIQKPGLTLAITGPWAGR